MSKKSKGNGCVPPGSKVKWSKAHDPKSFDSATGRLVLDWSGRLDRIERMLKWLVVQTMMVDRGGLAGMNYSPEAMGKQINELVGELPDISDILEEKDV